MRLFYFDSRFDLIVMTREDGLLSENFCQNYLKAGGKIVRTYPQSISSDSFGFVRKFGLSIWRKFNAPHHRLDLSPLDYIRRLVDQVFKKALAETGIGSGWKA